MNILHDNLHKEYKPRAKTVHKRARGMGARQLYTEAAGSRKARPTGGPRRGGGGRAAKGLPATDEAAEGPALREHFRPCRARQG